MPHVDGKDFPYDKKGKKAAKKVAKKTGKKMTYEKGRKQHFGLK